MDLDAENEFLGATPQAPESHRRLTGFWLIFDGYRGRTEEWDTVSIEREARSFLRRWQNVH